MIVGMVKSKVGFITQDDAILTNDVYGITIY